MYKNFTQRPKSEMPSSATAHFHVFYEEADKDFAEKLIGQIDDFFVNICHKAGSDPGTDVYELYVCGSTDSFIFYTGKTRDEYQDWMVGNADIKKNRLCVASPRSRGDMSESYENYLIQVMLHEVVHIVFERLCRPEECDLWISEGIAVLLAGQTNIGYLSEKEYPRIASLGGREDIGAFANNGGYGYSGVYVWYLIELYGMEKFLSVYKGECPVEGLLAEGFEHSAILAYQTRYRP